MRKSHPEEFVQSYIHQLPSTVFRIYSLNRFVAKLMPPTGAVLDFGCGGGYLLQHLLRIAPTIELAGVEVTPRLVALARANNRSATIYESGDQLDQSIYDRVYTLDVIEHIADDNSALKTMYRSLKPGGELLVAVPALQALYTDFDQKMGHYRRYELNELQTKLAGAGFEQIKVRYWNWLGYVAVKMSKRLSLERPHNSLQRSLLRDIKNTLLQLWFVGIENHLNPRHGLTLIATARRPMMD